MYLKWPIQDFPRGAGGGRHQVTSEFEAKTYYIKIDTHFSNNFEVFFQILGSWSYRVKLANFLCNNSDFSYILQLTTHWWHLHEPILTIWTFNSGNGNINVQKWWVFMKEICI